MLLVFGLEMFVSWIKHNSIFMYDSSMGFFDRILNNFYAFII